MGLLSHVFYPWGFLLQGAALLHFVRRRPENYWFYVILFLGPPGALIYVIAEVIPDFGLVRGVFQGFGRKSRIQTLEATVLDNPSAGNYEELADLYFDQKEFAKAREALNKAIAARSDSVHAFYLRGRSSYELGDLPAAIPDLLKAVTDDPKFDYYRAAATLADAYARSKEFGQAEYWFAGPVEFSNTPEVLFNYARFFQLAGRREEAIAATKRLLAKKRTLPRYMQRVERPWFRKANSLLKDLSSSRAATKP
jgi:tetratricopeptide (TPR) repeat protein